MTKIDYEAFITSKIKSHPRKFEQKYPNETKIILKLIKQALDKKGEQYAYKYNYLSIAEYCIEVLGFTMVSKEGLRKIVARIAKENSCEL
jgi:hypothetical protein